ncbi:MAG: C1 family peptidase [Candidatus Saliniplasma sp.]
MKKRRKLIYSLGVGSLGFVILVVGLLFFAGIQPVMNLTEGNTEANVSYDLEERSHLMTEEEVQELRKNIGVYDPEKDYNLLVDGHGTGLLPPTEEQYESMIGSVKVVDSVNRDTNLLSSNDLTENPWFPPADTQGSQNSCAAWASSYYANTYMQAEAYGWDASTGNDEYIMSPAWSYNKINRGQDGGATLLDPVMLTATVGDANLATMPYDDSDYISWGDESAWRNSVKHRASGYETTRVWNTGVIKSWIDEGRPVPMAMDSGQYNFGSGNILHTGNYNAYSANHANTVVGYDDDVGVEGEMGAFKIINSWGSTWGPNNDGTYWMTYELFGDLSWDTIPSFTGARYDGDGSQPSLLAKTELSDTGERDADIELGIGSTSNPADSREPYFNTGSRYDFPSFMAFDITEFEDDWVGGTGSEDTFYWYTGSSDDLTTISSYKVEYYNGYEEGNPTLVSPESSDTPATTPATVTVDFTLDDPPEITVTRPNGGETFTSGTDETITWSTTAGENPIDYVDLYYSTDSGSSWTSIATGLSNSGSYTWTVPNEDGENCLIRARVIDTAGTSGEDTSDGTFSIIGTPPEPPGNLEIEHTGTSEDWRWLYDEPHRTEPQDATGLTSPGVFHVAMRVEVQAEPITELAYYAYNQANYAQGYLYEDGTFGQSPGELLCETEQVAEPGPNEWIEIPFTQPISVDGGYYWVILEVDDPDSDPNIVGRYDGYIEDNAWISTDGGSTWNELPDHGLDYNHALEVLTGGSDGESKDHNLVSWNASPDDPDEVEQYNIYRSELQSGPWDESTFLDSVSADGNAQYQYVDTDKGIADEILWWYVVRTVGANGLEEENTDAVQEPEVETSLFDVSLTTDTQTDGWNFVSFNLIPSDTSLTAILEDADYGITGSYDKLMYYDAETDEWLSYIPGRDAHFNGLNSWDHTMGVWIQMNADDTLTVEGTEPTSTDITLNPGWNMVSLPSFSSGNHGLPGEVDVVGFSDSSQENNIAYDYNPDNFEFAPGEGHWIHNPTDTAITWTVEY